MKAVHVWVDADSCPRSVRDYIIKKAADLSLDVSFVANRTVPVDEKLLINKKSSFEMITCENTPGAADNCIVSRAEKGDMIVTRDIALAAALAERGLCVLNDRGTCYTKNLPTEISICSLQKQGLPETKKTSTAEKSSRSLPRASIKR